VIQSERVSRLLIFDFDGVVADSEVLAGKRLSEVISTVEANVGKKLPANFPVEFQPRTLARFRKELRPVVGAREFIAAFPDVPRCIASSSSSDRLALCLDVLGLRHAFAVHVFSASLVARGKPHPDIYLYAAQAMNVDPSHAIVLEDSVSRVQAGVAAGMTVIGLLAASHIQEGHREQLLAAGAHYVAATFKQAEEITSALLMR
jgi:HAD superfamily hydrolase (TIGR01509 family)